jgi:hypothetical protein
VIWMSVQQGGMCASMNVSIHKAAINAHVQKATIKLEINVQVSNLFNMNRDFMIASFQSLYLHFY